MLKIEDEEEYTKIYLEKVLNKLDPQKVYDKLGENSVLLCYEKWYDIKGGKKFCHRRIVAKSLEENIFNLEIKELQ